ncbi:manganese transporter [Elstera litoralis]|uniref:Divalent metal cation transporter MntH n=1 Tax=Elstera litoralis TaxID=552518 RepID=A0A0F3IPV7_9PROT|nr:Nramp family divalent metal transporter [Elstera litoralis]KJV08780.1 manganese transporter [Elstera litoralis]
MTGLALPNSSTRLMALKRLLAFIGPGYLVAVGYMDPGNWATSLAAGSQYGYALLSVVLMASIMAMLLQALAIRVGVATGQDLAQLSRERFSPWVGRGLWVAAELAIVATDLAELIGTAIALQLLFGLPLVSGILLTGLDAVIILLLHRRGMRPLEAFVIGTMLLIVGCFVFQMIVLKPEPMALLGGLVPRASWMTDGHALYLAAGILGATIMPHNLYLHTALVQARPVPAPEKRQAIRFATIDSTVALTVALFVNGAILVVAATTFTGVGEGLDFHQAYTLLIPVVGTGLAATLFAIALLASGLNATVTATLAGQVVMEGFLRLKLSPALRRLLTRGLALVPAAVVASVYGEAAAEGLLVFSQVVLSLQLPFAVIPLLLIAGDRRRMGSLIAPRGQLVAGWACAAIVLGLNGVMIANLV